MNETEFKAFLAKISELKVTMRESWKVPCDHEVAVLDDAVTELRSMYSALQQVYSEASNGETSEWVAEYVGRGEDEDDEDE